MDVQPHADISYKVSYLQEVGDFLRPCLHALKTAPVLMQFIEF